MQQHYRKFDPERYPQYVHTFYVHFNISTIFLHITRYALRCPCNMENALYKKRYPVYFMLQLPSLAAYHYAS